MAIIQGFDRGNKTINGVRLHFWIGGPASGTPVVLCHGFLSTSYGWRNVAPLLAKEGFSVELMDMMREL